MRGVHAHTHARTHSLSLSLLTSENVAVEHFLKASNESYGSPLNGVSRGGSGRQFCETLYYLRGSKLARVLDPQRLAAAGNKVVHGRRFESPIHWWGTDSRRRPQRQKGQGRRCGCFTRQLSCRSTMSNKQQWLNETFSLRPSNSSLPTGSSSSRKWWIFSLLRKWLNWFSTTSYVRNGGGVGGRLSSWLLTISTVEHA